MITTVLKGKPSVKPSIIPKIDVSCAPGFDVLNSNQNNNSQIKAAQTINNQASTIRINSEVTKTPKVENNINGVIAFVVPFLDRKSKLALIELNTVIRKEVLSEITMQTKLLMKLNEKTLKSLREVSKHC